MNNNDIVNWDFLIKVSKHQRIEWYHFLNNYSCSEETLEKIINESITEFDGDCWHNIIIHQKVSEDFLIKHFSLIKHCLSIPLIHRKFSPEFLDIVLLNCERTDYYISLMIKYQKNLPNEFIIKHFSHRPFYIACLLVYQELSEEFLEEILSYKELNIKGIWNIISEHQPLSDSFVKKYFHLLNLKKLLRNDKMEISEELYLKIIECVG